MICDTIGQVRENIDRLDSQIVQLICERESYVRQAARLKTDVNAVKAPNRVEQVIEKVRGLAQQNSGNADVVEQVYRTMISSFINMEMEAYNKQK